MTTALCAGSAQQLGDVIRQARHDLGLSQTALAKRARVGRQWLNAFEAGDKTSAPLDMLLRIAAALDAELLLVPERQLAQDTFEQDAPTPARGGRATAAAADPTSMNDPTAVARDAAMVTEGLNAIDTASVLEGLTIDTASVLGGLGATDTTRRSTNEEESE